MDRRGGKITFLVGSVTALFGAVAACGSSYGSDDPVPAAAGTEAGVDVSVTAADVEAGPTTDGDVCSSSNLKVDGKNCGRCGFSCLGGTCDDGICQPVTVAKGLSQPGYLRAAGQSLFVLLSAGVIAISKEGGSATTILKETEESTGLALGLDDLVIAGPSGVRLVKRDGTGNPVKISSLPATEAVPVGDYVFACRNALGEQLLRYARSASSFPEKVITNLDTCESITGDGIAVYFGGTVLHRMSTPPLKVSTEIASEKAIGMTAARRVVMDTTRAYSFAPGKTGILQTDRTTAGTQKELAVSPEPIEAGDLAIDDRYVYWTTGRAAGGVYRVEKAGGQVEPIATGLAFPKGIAVDEVAVYWTERESGTIRKRAK